MSLMLSASCTCGSPPTISNGRYNPVGGPWNCNTFVDYQCDSGYNMEGTSRIQCDANGRWSTQAPFCRQGAYAKISPTFFSSLRKKFNFWKQILKIALNYLNEYPSIHVLNLISVPSERLGNHKTTFCD